jgi:hypothetical protein
VAGCSGSVLGHQLLHFSIIDGSVECNCERNLLVGILPGSLRYNYNTFVLNKLCEICYESSKIWQ